MTPEFRQRVSDAWGHYLELSEDTRDAYLEQLRQNDPHAARELELLIAEGEVSDLVNPITPPRGTANHSSSQQSSFDSVAATISHVGADGNRAHAGELQIAIPGYEILGKLGEGGMGVVYKARHVTLNRLAAVKTLLAGRPQDRFRIEAEAVARLRHPHIVQIFEVGSVEGRPFFALEFLEGGDLNQKLRDLLPASREAAVLLEKLARATHHAHEQGVVHRDLKPHNILLDAAGQPKITDFGLAKIVGPNLEELTHTGQVLGTPYYMSPEQAQGDKDRVGPLSDVYALGAILYKCLTGRAPFQGSTLQDTIKQVITDDPLPPRRLQPQAPRELETICLKCLEKQPENRYASAGELAEDLRRFLDGKPIKASPVSAWERGRRWCTRNRTAAALIAVVATAVGMALVGGVWLYTTLQLKDAAELVAGAKQQEADARQKEADAARNEKNKADEAARLARELAANQEYFALLNSARQRVARKVLGWTWTAFDELQRAALLPTRARKANELRTEAVSCCAGMDVRKKAVLRKDFPADALAFSPDGTVLAAGRWRIKELGLLDTGKVLLLDPATGKEVRDPLSYPHSGSLSTLLNGGIDGADSAAFSPDGKRLAVGTKQGWIHSWDLTRENPQPVSSKAVPGTRITHLFFAGDGLSIFAGITTSTLTRWDATKPNTVLARHEAETRVRNMALSPDGKQLACSMYNGTLVLFDPQSLTPMYPALPLETNVLCFAPDGRLLAAATAKGILLIDLQARQVVRTFIDPRIGLAHRSGVSSLAFSADGALLISVAAADEDRTARLWEVGTGRLAATCVFAEQKVRRAALDRDGRALALTNYSDVVVYELGGMREQTWLAQHSQPIRGFQFTRDGSSLACITAEQLTLWNGDTGRLRGSRSYSNPLDLSSLAIDPGGTVVVYTGADQKLHYWDLADGRPWPAIPTSGGNRPRFSPDGELWAIFPNGVVESWGREQTARLARWQNFTVFDGMHDIRSIAAGSRWVLAGSRNSTTGLLRAGDGELQAQLKGPPGPVNSVALHPDETLAATGSQQGTVQIRAIPEDRLLVEFHDHDDGVDTLSFSPDGSLLATGSADQRVNLYHRTGSGFELVTALPFPAPVVQAAFHPDGKRLVVLLFGESALRVWHLDRLRDRFVQMKIDDGKWLAGATDSLPGESSPAGPPLTAQQVWERAMRLWEGGDRDHALLCAVRALEMATADQDPAFDERHCRACIRMMLDDAKPVLEFPLHNGVIESLAFSPDGKTLLTAGWDNTVCLSEPSTMKPRVPRLQHQARVFAEFSPDGKYVLTTCWDRTAQLWETSTGKPVGQPLTHPGPVWASAFTPDGRAFVTACREPNELHVWDTEKQSPVRPPVPWPAPVSGLFFAPDGKHIAVLSNTPVNLLSYPDLASVKTVNRGDFFLQRLSWNRDGSKFLVGGAREGQLFDFPTCQPVGAPLAHASWVLSAAFAPGEKWIATGSHDSTFKLWGRDSTGQGGFTTQQPTPIHRIAVSPDGRHVVTGDLVGVVRFWKIPQPIEGSAEEVAERVGKQIGLQLRRDGRLTPIR